METQGTQNLENGFQCVPGGTDWRRGSGVKRVGEAEVANLEVRPFSEIFLRRDLAVIGANKNSRQGSLDRARH